MNKENYSKIKKYLEGRIENQVDAANPRHHLKTLAVYFAVVTGSRPNEAAYVVLHKRFSANVAATNERWCRIDYAATMGPEATKTHLDYVWLMPHKRNWFVELV